MEPDRWHQDGEEMVDSSPLRHMAGQVHRDIESVPLIRPENAMNAQLAALDQVQSTAIDLGLKFGPKLLREPAPLVPVATLADSSVSISLRPWVSLDAFPTAADKINKAVLESFRAGGISIPFPQREVRLLGQS